jgi:hypothetical protein
MHLSFARFFFLFSFLSFPFLWACSPNKDNSTTAEVDTDSVVSQVSEWGRDSLISEPSLSFFIPGGASKNAVCLVFLDPQGEGMEPLRLYKNLALDFGFAMAGSNLSKNGMDIETSKVVVNQLIAKIKNESGLDSARFYILGFSGGARVALQLLLLDSDFRGAVYAGAPGPVSRYDKPLFGFAGYQDMNYADLLSFESALDSPHPAHPPRVAWKT